MTSTQNMEMVAVNFNQQAETYLAQGKLNEAIAACEEALKIQPNFAGAYRNLARIWTQLKKAETAADCWYQALILDPKWATAEEHLTLGNTLVEQGKLEEATACYLQAIQINPNLVQAYHNLGEIFTSKNKFEEAIAYYRQAITLKPDAFGSHHSLGKLLAAKGNIDEAIACQHKSLEINPNYVRAYHSLGNVLVQKGELDSAIAYYSKAIELNPNYCWSYNSLGDVFLKQERWDQAINSYQKAIEMKGDIPWFYYNLAVALTNLKSWDEALAGYLSALQLQRDLPGIYNRIGYVLRQRTESDLDATVRDYCQAIQVNSDNGKTNYNLLNIVTDNSDFYVDLANNLTKQHQFSGAIVFYQIALHINPEDAKVASDLEDVLARKDELDRQISVYRSQIELDPNSAVAYTDLGNILPKYGELEESIVCHQKASELRGWHQCATNKYQFTQDWFTHNIPIWEKHLQQFAGIPGLNILEIGSFQGMSTCWLLDNILTDITARITSIDLYFQAQFDGNIAKTGVSEKVIKLEGLSQDLLVTLTSDYYEVAYIDGCHKASSVLQDTVLSWRLVKIGGLIIFDDYEFTFPENPEQNPKLGIDTFISMYQNQLEVIHKGYQLIVKKIANEKQLEEKAILTNAYLNLGEAVSAQGYLEEAISHYQKALELQPEISVPELDIKDLLTKEGEIKLADFPECLKFSGAQKNQISLVYHKLGKLLQETKQLDRAASVYWHSINLNPTFSWSYHYLGEILQELGKDNESRAAYCRAIELNPDFCWSYNNLGDVLMQLSRWEEAATAYRRGIELNPDFCWLHNKLGDALVKISKWEEAAVAYRRSIALNPDFCWSYYSLGEVLEEQHSWEEAVGAYRRAVELEAEDSWMCKKLGDALQQLGLWDEAIAIYKQGIGVDSYAYLCYEGLGLCFLEKKDWEGAIAYFIQALQIKPDLLEVYHKIGYALEQQGELEKSEYYCCNYQILPLKVLKKYCHFREDLTVTSEFDPSINYIKILPEDEIHLLPSKSLDGNIIFSENKYYLPKTFVAIIPEGRVWADVITSAVINSENKLVTDISTGCAELAISSDKLTPVEYIDGTVAFLSVRWGGAAYYHWMFDLIPRFELLRRSGIEIETIDKFIVNGTNRSYEKETLKTLGIPETKIIESSCGLHIKAKSLVVPSICYQGVSQISKWACEFIHREFLREKNGQKIEKLKRIYISRELASYRRFINEEEVLNFLDKWGFESVKLETMSVAEQAYCLANAEVVVAPHGAGLTNIVFCRPGTKVIEIFSPTYLPGCYWILSNICDLEHYYLIGESLENNDSCLPIYQDIKVDLDLLKKLIRTYAIM
ncbi:tetratricopeptide repeat protein [Kamptonema sp. UHCC 0994]|uniref:tetratricopeptide repeat protein n=1 Tax=Kamptonema sp. UHCC 0994 TaxID=3031329 RepID=UPI0023B941AF|nr:tetratricopeptide repeat protein [Kamptonema sp. UHCC 0994]MDF0554112.1 tetratricopeptide repeat protein [Kamptonema sp. UHCC 0994]